MSARKRNLSMLLAAAALPAVLLCVSHTTLAAPILGNASPYAVLAGESVTSTGSTVITSELGVSTGTAVSGFGPGLVNGGTIHLNDGSAIAAKTDFLSAYNNLAGSSVTQDLTG